jgi:integrase
VIALLMQTGMRLGELCSVRVESIEMLAGWSGTLRVIGKRTSANPTGEREVAFDRFAGSYLAPFLDVQGWQVGPLLRNESGRAVTSRTVERILERAKRRAGLLDVSLSPHDLRRAFITHFRRNNRGEEYDNILRKQVGHSSPSVTAIYDLIDRSDLVDVIRGPLC